METKNRALRLSGNVEGRVLLQKLNSTDNGYLLCHVLFNTQGAGREYVVFSFLGVLTDRLLREGY